MSHLERAEVYLQRSGNRTIDILVDTVSVNDHVPGVTLCREEFDSVFNIVVPHVRRWRSLVLKVRDTVCKAGARKHLSSCGPAPHLESLQLYHFEDWATSQELYLATVRPPVLVFAGDLPRLRNLFLIGVNLPWTASLPFLRDLEELQLALHSVGVRPTYEEWRRILMACPNLKRLSLHYSGPLDNEPWPEEPIKLPSLEELTLIDLDPGYLCRLFQHLSLGEIRRLRVELPEQDFTAFIDHVSKPNAPLFRYVESLHVAALNCSQEAWTAFIGSMTALKFLHVNFERVPVEFCLPLMDVTLMQDPPRDEQDTKGKKKSEPKHVLTCPRLETLKVYKLPLETLKSLCEIRASHGLPLTNLYIHEKDKKSDEDAEIDFGCRTRFFRYPDEEEEEEYDDDEEDEEEEGDDDAQADAEEDAEVQHVEENGQLEENVPAHAEGLADDVDNASSASESDNDD